MNWLKPLGIIGLGAVIASAIVSEPFSIDQTATVTIPVESTKDKVETVPVKTTTTSSTPVTSTVKTTQKLDVVEVTEKEKPKYVPVAEREKTVVVPKKDPVKTSSCHPSYSGCLKQNVGDYDCAGGSGDGPNYTGPVQVYGSDPFGLDRDYDGWGCEGN